jgi:hypothetical protein
VVDSSKAAQLRALVFVVLVVSSVASLPAMMTPPVTATFTPVAGAGCHGRAAVRVLRHDGNTRKQGY